MDYIAKNEVLNDTEMLNNAICVHNLLKQYCFSENAIAGILGNMESESRINSGAWQGYKKNEKLGFGLVQWTPSTKVISWLNDNGFKQDDLEGQCNRIIWELENGKQFYKTSDYPMSFLEFKTSNQTPEYLAKVFLNNYERPANREQPKRATNARKWYDYFNENVSRETLEGVVKGTHVNVRKDSNINSTVLGQVNTGDSVEVLGTFGEWVKIKFELEAYIHENYVK